MANGKQGRPHVIKPGHTVGLEEFGRILGRQPGYVRDAIRDGMPVKTKGDRGTAWEIETGPAILWLLNRAEGSGRERAARRGGAGAGAGEQGSLQLTPDMEDAKARKMHADALRSELAYLQARNAVLEVEAVARVVADACARVRARVLALPTKLAPQVITCASAAEAKAMLTTAVDAALRELTNEFEEMGRRAPAGPGGDLFGGLGAGDGAGLDPASEVDG